MPWTLTTGLDAYDRAVSGLHSKLGDRRPLLERLAQRG